MRGAVLSLFPGIDLLGRAFEEFGYMVVRGPDIILGQDVREFKAISGIFEGVIAGPPCQDFSSARRDPPTGYGLQMLEEFKRVVSEAAPQWWLMENVAQVPDVQISGYSWQRMDINLGWFSDCSRLRHIQFGSKDGSKINVTRRHMKNIKHGAATCSDNRTVTELALLQGLPEGFYLKDFNVKGNKKVIGNAVPLPVGRVLAQAVTAREIYQNICKCGCGRPVIGRQKYVSPACRKRAQRRRDRAPTI